MSKQTSGSEANFRQKRKFWLAHVKAWKDSNLSQAEYCRRQELKAHRLGYWVRKKSTKPNQSLALVEVPMPNITICGCPALKLVIDNRHQIEIADHFSPTALEQVLLVLRRIA